MNKIKNLKIRAAALALSSAMVLTTLTGCNKKENDDMNLLNGTLFEDASVMSFEDKRKDIVTYEGTCSSFNKGHSVYKSIITNKYITNNECTTFGKILENTFCIFNHYTIIEQESIINYLSSEEIDKLSKNKITKEELTTIIDRILNNDSEKENQNIKTK